MSERWVLVSNRLPFQITPEGQVVRSSGGLVSAIQGVHSSAKRIWCGVAPTGMDADSWQAAVHVRNNDEYEYIPLFVENDLYAKYYNGFCNDVLWPLIHYEASLTRYSNETWDAYRQVNQQFAEILSRSLKDDDLVWIHDFHFCLLPKLLKALRPRLRLGIFLHTPFPSSEIYRQLPVRHQLLEGLLAADLVGFQDYSYLRHFGSSVLRILGLDSDFHSIPTSTNLCRMGVFPVGIDTADWLQSAQSEAVISRAQAIPKADFLFLGVDRLDYIKGLDLKLRSFSEFLSRYPEVHGKVHLIEIAVPTRPDVQHYQDLHQEMNRLVGEVNGKFGQPDWTPIRYIYSAVPKEELQALYRRSDAIVITSKRDGMNLVCMEHQACQNPENPGSVILSEFTGAHSVLSEAIVINPWDIEATATAMKTAFDLSLVERQQRHQVHMQYLKHNTASTWAESFVAELGRTSKNRSRSLPLAIDKIEFEQIFFRHERPLLLFLDYDGTLVEIKPYAEQATLAPDKLQKLARLARLSNFKVAILSGRNYEFLRRQFGDAFDLAIEHGALFFDSSSKKLTDRISYRHHGLDVALEIMQNYTKRVPGSYIEQKTYCLAWHYRISPREYGTYQAMKLLEELEYGLANQPITLLHGKKVIEARPMGAEKGNFANWYLQCKVTPDFFPIAIGDDRTDEDLFEALKHRGVSIKVGPFLSRADFALKNPAEVWRWLDMFYEIALSRAMQNHRTAAERSV